MSRFYFTSPTSTSSDPDLDPEHTLTLDSDEEDTLPYPKPIARAPFLAADFSPAEYLSSLNVRTRHQTLEDLRSELRERSQDLSKELLDLVNSNYQDFLGLGGSLKGGDEKVEEVRVGLLGFARGVEELKVIVEQRRQDVETLLAERERLWRERQTARALLDVETRLSELEQRLMVVSVGKPQAAKSTGDDGPDEYSDDGSEEGDDDDDDEDKLQDNIYDSVVISMKKLQMHVQLYLCLLEIMKRIGPEHPYLKAQDSRTMRLRNTLLLDLSNALKQAKSAKVAGRSRLLKVMAFYRDLDEDKEAIKVLKGI